VPIDPYLRGVRERCEGTGGLKKLFCLDGTPNVEAPRRASSCGICRGDTGALSSDKFEKYGLLLEKGGSEGSSVERRRSDCRWISACMVKTTESSAHTLMNRYIVCTNPLYTKASPDLAPKKALLVTYHGSPAIHISNSKL
jgi:hypothetical protein